MKYIGGPAPGCQRLRHAQRAIHLFDGRLVNVTTQPSPPGSHRL